MRSHLLGALVAALLCTTSASAEGTFVATDGARDMVYDAQSDIVYINTGSKILRYRVRSASFLSPIEVGGTPAGIDLSPDGRTLAVADSYVGSAQSAPSNHYFLVDTKSLAVQKVVDPDNAQSFGVTYLPGGDLVVSGQSVQLLSAKTGLWRVIMSFFFVGWHDESPSSGDGSRLGISLTGISPNEWWVYDVASGTFPASNDFSTSEGGTPILNHDGSQFLLGGGAGFNVHNGTGAIVGAIGTNFSSRPLGAAYDPVRQVAYFPWTDTSQVRVYDMATLKQTGTLDLVSQFSSSFDANYRVGRMRFSHDGSLLMAIVPGGLRIDRLYAPLSASDASASTVGGKAVSIPVSGSLGVTGAITYGVAHKPAHGTVAVSGNTVTYTPDFSFSGTETFKYQAHYGQAVANGTITVQVSPAPNQPPVAADNYVNLWSTNPASIDVLANDSDPDGQALSIIAVAQPSVGTVAIQNNKLLYTPPASGYAITNFKYTISDGHGGTASAQVYLVVRKIR